MSQKYIVMNSEDNCATSLVDIQEGTEIKHKKSLIKINHEIPLGHKFALSDIKKGDIIRKYGQIIGIATKDISIGDWIHTHNITSHYLEEVVE
ncbi:MAG: D-galactarate dehydratase [Candidatus Lokiarchaeota archaeon]|nr:D-galactarate dehydratase [Candidatus Lokiarchaeota archaeon]MBD3200191.1 D-galactarate dehydratase [Candidatus Lokiarchaeota archaeon]